MAGRIWMSLARLVCLAHLLCRGLFNDTAVLTQPALYDAVFSKHDIRCAVAYTPIELQLYDEFARITRAHALTGDTNSTDDAEDHTNSTVGVQDEDDDADWAPPGGVRRVVWNAQFGDHHWIVAVFVM